MPAGPQDLVQRQHQVLDRVRELVGVPAVLGVAAVGVDAAQDPVRGRVRDLVVEAVARQRRVVGLDVDPVLVLQPVAHEEAVDGLRRRSRTGAWSAPSAWARSAAGPEADPVLVLGDEVQEPRQLVALALQVRVEQRVVALAPAPQDVVLAAQPLGDLEHVLDLRRRVGEHLGVGVGRRAGLVARVA